MSRKYRVTNMTLLLVLVLLSITIGYAVLSTNLNINGTSKINNATWDIHFDNIVINSNSVSGENVTKAATIDDDTHVSYNIKLMNLGDFYEFTVDVVNAGSIDGMIETISSKLNGTEIDYLPNYLLYSVTYVEGDTIEENHILKSEESETYKIRIEFNRDINESDLPSTEQTLNLSFSVNYIQKDENAISPVHNINGTYYHTYSDDSFFLDGFYNPSVPLFTNQLDALTYFNNKYNINSPVYIKSVFTNGIVTDSRLEFTVTSDMVNSNSSMSAGNYELIGGGATGIPKLYYNYDSQYYNGNKQVLKTAFGEGNCRELSVNVDVPEDKYYECSAGGLVGYADTQGSVRIVFDNTDYYCGIQIFSYPSNVYTISCDFYG